MNEFWVCTGGGKRLVIRCEGVVTAWEARQFAVKKLEADPSAVDMRAADQLEGSMEPDIVIRWTGDDYAHGGSVSGRRMQERAPGAEDWVDV